MRSSGVLFSAAITVVLIAHLGECAAHKSASLRAPAQDFGESHHDEGDEVQIHHHSSSTLRGDIPKGSKGDKHALKHALHLGKVNRQKHSLGNSRKSVEKKADTTVVKHIESDDIAADVGDGQAKTAVHVKSADRVSTADGHAEDVVETDGNDVDSDFGDEAGDMSGDDVKDGSMVATDNESDDEGDDSSGGGSKEDLDDEAESSTDAADASSYREVGSVHVEQPPVDAPVATTTAATITGMPGQLPGNDGEVTMATTTASTVTEEIDGARTESGLDPGRSGMDDSEMKDPAVGNSTGALDNSTANSSAGDNSSTVTEDRGQEYGDAAQAHDDAVASEARTGSTAATVSAGDSQGSGVTALIVGLIIILSLIAVALCLGTKL